MSPKTRALLTDVSTWLGALFAALSVGWGELFSQFDSVSKPFYAKLAQWNIDPALFYWTVTGVFALPAAYALLSALARRSLLRRPKRFIIKAEDPRHLIGREKETDGLAKACADNTLTVLKGESGAGKSALVKAGLKLKLDEDPHSRLLPLLIDASGLDWDGGLRTALAQAWAAIPKERRQQLGDTSPAVPADKIFERLAKLPELAPQRLLLILDQIDDYFVAHREHFLGEGVEDGGKTRRAALADFAAALSTGPNLAKDAAPLLDFLERNRLLRRQSGQDGDFLLLYHDYLARGVRDAYKQANRWTELLRAKTKEFDEALTWRQRWVALLSLRDQLGLALARLRGRFNYGVYRGLAGWSLLRLVPLLMPLLALLFFLESFVWLDLNQLGVDSFVTLQRFRYFGYAPMPQIKEIRGDSFHLGDNDEQFIQSLKPDAYDNNRKKFFGGNGIPASAPKSYWMGETEVTYDEFDYFVWCQQNIPTKCLPNNLRYSGSDLASHKVSIEFPRPSPGGRGGHPVTQITWVEAMEYAKWYGALTDKTCRLPTEVEWEFAARGNTKEAYWWGNKVEVDKANCKGCGTKDWTGKQAAPVRSYKPNPYGLYDTAGNVWEWTCSNWSDEFMGNEKVCADKNDNSDKTARGGAWNYDKNYSRSSGRILDNTSQRDNRWGFRIMCK